MELILNGDTVSNSATPELISSAVRSLTGEGDSFAILAQAEQQYIQTMGGPEQGFVLEYRDGSEAEHYSCKNHKLTADQVIDAFDSYLAEDGRWKTEFEWEPHDFSYSGGGSGPNVAVIVGVIAVAAFLIWKFAISS